MEKPKILNLYTTPIHMPMPASELERSMVDEQRRQYTVAETYVSTKCRHDCEYEHIECKHSITHRLCAPNLQTETTQSQCNSRI